MAVGMSPVHWQLVRLSAVPVLVKLPRLCCSHGLYTGFSAMGSSAGRFPLPCVLVPSLRILWLESPRVTGCVWSREKPGLYRDNRSFILRICVVSRLPGPRLQPCFGANSSIFCPG